jgi:hypothetical protein
MKDLIVLVPDKNMEFSVKALLNRTDSLRIRSITYDIKVHPHRDPGVYNDAHDFLRLFIGRFSNALVMLDKEGCGRNESTNTITNNVQSRLDISGWWNRSKVIVIDPELEIWVWSMSPQVAACIGWEHNDLRNWLRSEGNIREDTAKPDKPKEVFEKALRFKGKARSSSIFAKLAERVGLNHCSDSAFLVFKDTLQNWFASE